MELLLALKDCDRDATRASTPSRRSASGSITWSRRARTSTTAGSRRTCTRRCSSPSSRRRSSCSTSISTRSRPRSTTARSTRPDHRRGARRPTSASCARSRRRSSVSDSGKLSFRQEVVRKAMVAYKRGEKFTLDSHAPLHDAVEQYLFEQRRDVLRLVTSTARPDDETRAEDLGGRAAAGRRVRLRRAQRARSAELRHHPARTGVNQGRTIRDRRRDAVVRPLLARRARLAAPQREGARGGEGARCPSSSRARI